MSGMRMTVTVLCCSGAGNRQWIHSAETLTAGRVVYNVKVYVRVCHSCILTVHGIAAWGQLCHILASWKIFFLSESLLRKIIGSCGLCFSPWHSENLAVLGRTKSHL